MIIYCTCCSTKDVAEITLAVVKTEDNRDLCFDCAIDELVEKYNCQDLRID